MAPDAKVLACSNCGRPICVECSRDAVVGQKCPECTTPEHRTRVIPARTITHSGRRVTPVTWGLVAINVVVFGLQELIPALRIGARFSQFPPAVDAGELRFRFLITTDTPALPELAAQLEQPPVVLPAIPSPGKWPRAGSLPATELNTHLPPHRVNAVVVCVVEAIGSQKGCLVTVSRRLTVALSSMGSRPWALRIWTLPS